MNEKFYKLLWMLREYFLIFWWKPSTSKRENLLLASYVWWMMNVSPDLAYYIGIVTITA